MAERISEPLGTQGPDVLEWSRSLRSRSPSPSRQRLRSRSPSPTRLSSARSTSSRQGPYLSEVQQSLPNMSISKKTSTINPMRKSTGSLAATLSASGKVGKTKNKELKNIETEYIKNLQQQIYFLELESNYLRDQASKATEMHPKMTAEAERMLAKLRAMQADIDGLQIEVKRRETDLAVASTEREKLHERIRDEEVARNRDKRMLMDEVIELKKEKDVMERNINNKDTQLLEAKTELDRSATALKNAEVKIETLRNQLDQRIEQNNMTQIVLDEKRTELVSIETQLREVEDKYYNQTIQIQDKVTNDLRDEVRLLRQKLKETEMAADHDRYLKSKLSEDTSQLARENAALTQQISDLRNQLDREQAFREAVENRQTQSIADYVQLKDKEKEARLELGQIHEQLRKEQEKNLSVMSQLTKHESVATTTELQLNTSRSRVTELENLHSSVEKENSQLRKDKILLVDHVSELQRKLELKEQEVVLMRSQVQSLEIKVKDVEHLKSLESTVQSQKWEEFEKLAENMRTLSHTMASTSGSTSSRVLQY